MTTFGGVDRALSVDEVSESINDTSEQFRADWGIDNPASALDGVIALAETVATECGDSDAIGPRVEAYSTDARRVFRPLFVAGGFSQNYRVGTGDRGG